MLHDWPEAETRQFLARAHKALDPGGTLLIFERSLLEVGEKQVPYSVIPLLLFFRSYRSQEDYAAILEQAGFKDIRFEAIELDMPFMLVCATTSETTGFPFKAKSVHSVAPRKTTSPMLQLPFSRR